MKLYTFKHLCRAVDPKNPKVDRTAPWYDGVYLIGTNGHRMHMAPVSPDELRPNVKPHSYVQADYSRPAKADQTTEAGIVPDLDPQLRRDGCQPPSWEYVVPREDQAAVEIPLLPVNRPFDDQRLGYQNYNREFWHTERLRAISRAEVTVALTPDGLIAGVEDFMPRYDPETTAHVQGRYLADAIRFLTDRPIAGVHLTENVVTLHSYGPRMPVKLTSPLGQAWIMTCRVKQFMLAPDSSDKPDSSDSSSNPSNPSGT